MKISFEKLKQILVDAGYVSQTDFDEARQSAADIGRSLSDVLIFRGLVKEEVLGKLIAEYLKVPYLDLSRLTIKESLLKLIPEKLARKYRVIPFDKDGYKLKVAMEDPQDFEALEFVKRQSGLQVIPYYATSSNLNQAFGQYKRNIRADFEKVVAESLKENVQSIDLLKAAERLPIIKVMDMVMEYAVAEEASDVHIETLADEVIIRFRIDGILHDIIKLSRGIEIALVARIKILSNLKIDEHRIPQDGRYKFISDGEDIGLRVSIIPGFYGENVVMRLLPESSRPLSLEELGLTGINLERVNKNIKKPNGMILVTGPTGSGKTTTLYSLLNMLNTVKVKICTIEDPIEYGIRRVNQIQVYPKVGLTFAAGLRSLLRHDPDIIMVGEIRDEETAEIAVHSALTGHLVLSTLHTNDAAGTIPRLLDMGIEPYLLSSTLNTIVAQRLVRKICSTCLSEYLPDKAVLTALSKDLKIDLSKQKFYKGQGCQECHHSGYKGRVGIYEVLATSPKLRVVIEKRSSSDLINKVAIDEKMVDMMQDGLNKVSAGLTTIEEILRVVWEK